jgi:acyl carrier protein
MTLEELIAAVLDVEPTAVTATASREVLPQWDSLGHLSILSAVEETYSVQFSTEEMRDATSVAALRSLLAEKGVTG